MCSPIFFFCFYKFRCYTNDFTFGFFHNYITVCVANITFSTLIPVFRLSFASLIIFSRAKSNIASKGVLLFWACQNIEWMGSVLIMLSWYNIKFEYFFFLSWLENMVVLGRVGHENTRVTATIVIRRDDNVHNSYKRL